MATEIDVKIPRESICQTFHGSPGACPKCGGTLIQRYQSYLLATLCGRRIGDSFCAWGKFGWFCETCPVVVLNIAELQEQLANAPPQWGIGGEILELGLLDLEAIPKSKRHVPIGTPGNPAPLVKFSNLHAEPRARERTKAVYKTSKKYTPQRRKWGQ